jgi:hypothetical protein
MESISIHENLKCLPTIILGNSNHNNSRSPNRGSQAPTISTIIKIGKEPNPKAAEPTQKTTAISTQHQKLNPDPNPCHPSPLPLNSPPSTSTPIPHNITPEIPTPHVVVAAEMIMTV